MNSDNKKDECIQVVVRCRPMNGKEREEKRTNIIGVDIEEKQVSIKNPAAPEEVAKFFTYDASYDEKTQQKLFYEESCFSIIESTLEGFNSTIFAYGQTGCGKSFTMQGPSTTNEDMRGVIPNSFAHIFQSVKASKDIEFLIRCSYLELYNEVIRDLLCNPKSAVKCELKEDTQKGIFVKGLTDVVVENEDDLNRMLEKGLTNRTTAATNMNAESSRSHSIFTIIVEMSTKEADGKEMLRVGKLNLVDLAGSERQKKTGASGDTMKEGIKINISLSCLGNVISALSEGNARHIPYRDSQLTRLLQDSLGGNTKTMMIAAISPADYNYDETMSTLRYANRAKNIKNKPKINEDPKDAVIREYKDEIEKLRKLLMEKDSIASSVNMNAMNSSQYATQQQSQQLQQHQQHQQQEDLKISFPTDGFSQQPPVDSDKYEPSSGGVEMMPVKSQNQKPQQQGEYEESYHDDTESDANSLYHEQQLREKESEIERERRLREEMAQRLQQLESLLVNNHEGESIKKASPIKQTKESVEQEEEALRKYKERKLKNKKKREAQQQAELQRILEEKRNMEEELEELRQSTQASNNNQGGGGGGFRTITPTTAAAAGGGAADDGKKLLKMKRKYEKKLAAFEDELNDMRDDFYYQRKELMDAVVEQEKDTKLYEMICRSLLSDKDLKKIIDKCRYDEESDEWIVPLSKKRNMDHLDAVSNSTSLPFASGSNNNSGNNMPKFNYNNSSLLPDINNRALGGSDNSKVDMGSTMVLPKFGLSSGANGSLSARNEKQYKSSSPVPMLTLPGGSVTSASMMNTPPTSAPNNKMPAISSSRLPSGISGSVPLSTAYDQNGTDSGRGGSGIGYNDQQQQSAGNDKKKSKTNKVPKMPANKMNEQSSQQNNNSAFAPQQVKMPSIGSGGQQQQQQKAAVPFVDSYSNADYGSLIDEAGTGENAGPLNEWGFIYDDEGGSGGDNKLRGGGGGIHSAPEMENDCYSEDEDFEQDGGGGGGGEYKNNASQQSKGKNKHGKKKKKKQSQNHDDNNNYGHHQNSSPRAALTLPPI